MAPAADSVSSAPAASGSPAAAVHRLGHVALRVTDMERAKSFYTALWLQLTWDAADWAYLQSPVTGDGVALLSPDYKAAGPHFAFHLDNRAAVDAVHDQLAAAGHRVGPVHDHRDGTASFYLQDPEGNWLEVLYEPPAGIPSNTGAAAIPAPARPDGASQG
jgi:catechol 2,3-dioxygenase-like lactoylglutathione lyase family enzyme